MQFEASGQVFVCGGFPPLQLGFLYLQALTHQGRKHGWHGR